jgi:GLPGLI family protein
MKNIIYLILIFLCAQAVTANAQFAHFTNNGVIEYEKSVNMFATLKPKNDDNVWQKEFYDKYKSTQPQFIKYRSKLYFNINQSLFKPNQEDNNNSKGGYWGGNTSQINEVSTDFSASKFITLKKVFEEDFLIKDSLRKIDWKITSEVRNIAGYNCRRANAIIMDSIYVVAFYTDQIPVSGGPESFTGLPGMILGIALPYEHITWFATKISEMPIDPKDLTLPATKKQAITLNALKEKISSSSDWLKESLKTLML